MKINPLSSESVAKVGLEPTPAFGLPAMLRIAMQAGHPSGGGDINEFGDKSLCSPPGRGTQPGSAEALRLGESVGWDRRWLKKTFASSSSFLIIFLAMFFLAGCVGYRLGSTLPPDIKTIYVPLFENLCRDPLIENDATAATIAELQKDGTLKVVNVENADVILKCTLTGISLSPLRYKRSDVTRPNEYRLTLSASFTLTRIRTQEILCEATVIGESTFPFYGNLVSAKQAATPRAAEDLAKRIVEKAIEAW